MSNSCSIGAEMILLTITMKVNHICSHLKKIGQIDNKIIFSMTDVTLRRKMSEILVPYYGDEFMLKKIHLIVDDVYDLIPRVERGNIAEFVETAPELPERIRKRIAKIDSTLIH